MRLFLGTFLNKEFVEKIPFDEIQKSFEGDLKPIKKENIHMTWLFIGDVDDENLKKTGMPFPYEIVEKHLDTFKNLVFTSNRLELWPPKRPPRLIVLEGELNKAVSFTSLANDLKRICSPDIKDNFLPHITIARFKKDKTVKRNVGAPGRAPFPRIENFIWRIKEVSLVDSTLSSSGPTYKKIKNWEFKAE